MTRLSPGRKLQPLPDERKHSSDEQEAQARVNWPVSSSWRPSSKSLSQTVSWKPVRSIKVATKASTKAQPRVTYSRHLTGEGGLTPLSGNPVTILTDVADEDVGHGRSQAWVIAGSLYAQEAPVWKRKRSRAQPADW